MLLRPGALIGRKQIRAHLEARYIHGSPLQNLPATSRATVSPMYADASGDLVQYAATNVALVNGDSVACWPAFTNLLSRSEELDNAAWTKSGVSITANDTTAPDGETTADLIIPSASLGSFKEIQQNVSVTSGATYCLSFFCKAGGYQYVQIIGASGAFGSGYVNFDVQAGTRTALVTADSTIAGSGIVDFGDGYYRVWAAFQSGATGSSRMAPNIIPAEDSARGASWSGDGSSGIYLWGVQLTQSSYLLPYVPTAGSSVAVDASEPVVPWPSGLVNDFVVSLVANPDVFVGAGTFFEINSGSTNDRLRVYQTTTDEIGCVKRVSSTTLFSEQSSTSPLSFGSDVTIRLLLSSKRGLRGYAGSSNIFSNSNTDDINAASTLNIGWNGIGATENMLGKIRSINVHKVAPNITDDEVLSL